MIAVEARKQVLATADLHGARAGRPDPDHLHRLVQGKSAEGARPGLFDLTVVGINISIAALAAVSAFLLIVVVSLFAGETVSGEANWGTLSYLLVRPVSRNRVLAPNWWSRWAWRCSQPFWSPSSA